MKYKENDYIFASSAVRSLETNLMTPAQLERLAACRSTREIFSAAAELGFKDPGTEDPYISVAADLKEFWDHVVSLMPDSKGLEPLRLPYDYHNLKALLKARAAKTLDKDNSFEIPEAGLLYAMGTISIPDILRIDNEQDLYALPDEMAEAVKEAQAEFSGSADPQRIDLCLDKACFEHVKKSADSFGSPFIKGYVALLIDTVNIKTVVRLRAMDMKSDVFEALFIPGGNVPLGVYTENYILPPENLIAGLGKYPALDSAVRAGITALVDTGHFTVLETKLDDVLITYARRAKDKLWGIEVPAAYLIAKENETKIIRIMLAAAAQGITGEDLRNRLRECY